MSSMPMTAEQTGAADGEQQHQPSVLRRLAAIILPVLVVAGLLMGTSFLSFRYQTEVQQVFLKVGIDTTTYAGFLLSNAAAQMLWVVCIVLVCLRLPVPLRDQLALRRPDDVRAAMRLTAKVALCALALIVLIVVAVAAFMALHPEGKALIEQYRTTSALRPPSGQAEIMAFGLIAVMCAPVVEELLFRGYLVDRFLKGGIGIWPAVLVAAIVFAIAHFDRPWPAMIVIGFSGLAMGVLRARTGSVYPGMLLHAGWNGTLFALGTLATSAAT